MIWHNQIKVSDFLISDCQLETPHSTNGQYGHVTHLFEAKKHIQCDEVHAMNCIYINPKQDLGVRRSIPFLNVSLDSIYNVEKRHFFPSEVKTFIMSMSRVAMASYSWELGWDKYLPNYNLESNTLLVQFWRGF